MQIEMKLANECVDCLTAFMRSRVTQEVERSLGEGSAHKLDCIRLENSQHGKPAGQGSVLHDPEQLAQADLDAVTLMMAERNARLKFFDHDLFFDPTWAMLLDLYRSALLGKPLCVSSICLGSGVPSTTALRYLRILEDRGYVERVSDELDKRRSFVSLTLQARDAMAAYVDSLRNTAPARKFRG